jgi:hypothetical protein
MSLWLTILVLSCSPPEPVLSGIPAAPILTPDAEEPAGPERSAPKVYVKPDGVDVDVRHLCGKRIEEVRAELHQQLGDQENVRDLSGNHGREIQYTRGRVRVADETVYMVSVPLNEPLYRREALQRLGFPAFTGGVIRTSRDYRINNVWDFRRIRMMRSGRDEEKVSKVEVWRWLPRERQ